MNDSDRRQPYKLLTHLCRHAIIVLYNYFIFFACVLYSYLNAIIHRYYEYYKIHLVLLLAKIKLTQLLISSYVHLNRMNEKVYSITFPLHLVELSNILIYFNFLFQNDK